MILRKDAQEIAVNAIHLYAWWKDGVEYVGSCGKTFAKAKEEILAGEWDDYLQISEFPITWNEMRDE